MQTQLMLDTLWVMIAAILVFFMNAGFALLESGLCRAKNTVNILAKNFIVFGLAVIGFWSMGYALMFGSAGSFAGSDGWFLDGLPLAEEGELPLFAVFFFQLCFAATAATIVSGAVAERIKIQAFMVFAVLLTAVIYPIVGHWVWGRGGWLAERGFVDFAGSTVVHSVGGWAALVGAVLLGPRLGKYDEDGRARPIPGHNIALATLGGLVLWLGWFGFNGGSELAMNANVARVAITTALAAAFGTIAATIWAWRRVGKPDLTLIINGMLGGLVGITAGCRYVEPYGAAVIGATAGVLVIEAVLFFDRRRIDDPVGATSVHLVCGIYGTLMVGVFGKQSIAGSESFRDGLLYGGGFEQLYVQAQGVLATALFVGGLSFVAWLAIQRTVGMRVSEEEEMLGLDLGEMGMEAYPAPSEREGGRLPETPRELAAQSRVGRVSV